VVGLPHARGIQSINRPGKGIKVKGKVSEATGASGSEGGPRQSAWKRAEAEEAKRVSTRLERQGNMKYFVARMVLVYELTAICTVLGVLGYLIYYLIDWDKVAEVRARLESKMGRGGSGSG